MAERTRVELKKYFEAGDKPKEEEFADLIDSFVNKQDDEVSTEGLEKVTEGGNTGWRLADSAPSFYGDIGKNAVDLSISTDASDSRGATGEGSVAFGYNTKSSGGSSTTFGNSTQATGLFSTAFGTETRAYENFSTAFGSGTLAEGYYSTAFGKNTQAVGENSTAFGDGTKATGSTSTAFGKETQATGSIATAFGYSTHATAEFSTAFGLATEAKAGYSTTFGFSTLANGEFSTAFGSLTRAYGDTSTAFGKETQANGNFSTAFGIQSRANSYGETCFGLYPEDVVSSSKSAFREEDYILRVGIGKYKDNRKDGFRVQKNGAVTANALTPDLIDSADDTVLVTKEWVNNNFSANIEGEVTISASGTEVITIPHTIGTKPSVFIVVAATADAAGVLYVTADENNVYVHYATPPAGDLSYQVSIKK